MVLSVGSLFSGIGGFDLGFERAGLRCVWQCEIDPYCQRVLEKHWPDVLRVPDIRDIRAGVVPGVDVLCGGFPCQDISLAGKGAGIDGSRSGLWSEYARLIGELRPRYVIVENVAALLARGMGRVLGDLAALGYDAEWDCIPASAVGAPHRRDRLWIVAYPAEPRLEGLGIDAGDAQESEPLDGRPLADTSRDAQAGTGAQSGAERERVGACGEQGRAREVAYSDGMAGPPTITGNGGCGEVQRSQQVQRAIGCGGSEWDQWRVEPDVGRVADGVPARVDRLRSLGNALVPQIAQWIGDRIMAWEEQHTPWGVGQADKRARAENDST